ncbi:MAG TPA: aminocarboxymuconate-semialdehyde decarboxylase, partial [Micromonosporaceae bacterium]|nr:aminocarboxymuconate-semialdehyde decarboxylase [Micromonosporaceae bacterium]
SFPTRRSSALGVPVRTPREAMRGFYVDDLVHDPEMLRLAEATFGEDHVLVGSDWPFPMGCDTINTTRATARATQTERLTRPGGRRPASVGHSPC